MKTLLYEPAQHIEVTVRFARNEGVYVDLPYGGTGIVSTRCWGGTADRIARIRELRSGQALKAIVKSWNPDARSASLVLPECEDLLVRKAWNRSNKPDFEPIKPDFEPIKVGACLIFDTANIVGDYTDYAGQRLKQTQTTVARLGYRPVFLLEHWAYTWMLQHQPSEYASTELSQFVEANVTLLNSEADLVMLQLLRQIPDAVGVTNDKLSDYAKVFSDIVGSSKVRPYSLIKIGSEVFLSIDGFTEAIPFTPAMAVEMRTQADSETSGQLAPSSSCPKTEDGYGDGDIHPQEQTEKWVRLKDRRSARQSKEHLRTTLMYRAFTARAA